MIIKKLAFVFVVVLGLAAHAVSALQLPRLPLRQLIFIVPIRGYSTIKESDDIEKIMLYRKRYGRSDKKINLAQIVSAKTYKEIKQDMLKKIEEDNDSDSEVDSDYSGSDSDSDREYGECGCGMPRGWPR